MGSWPYLRFVTSLASVLTVLVTTVSSAEVRSILSRLFSPTLHPIRFLILLLTCFLNAKSIPLVWHLRFGRTMLYQLYLQKTPLPIDALFRPIVTTSMYTPLNECDYNGHKSNSTYFADFDIARLQHISCILRKGIRNVNVREARRDAHTLHGQPVPPPPPGKFMIALGAVSCHFKREIKPYERFDIWTRVLSWDRKWVYIVSHMVRPGVAMPEGWALQPWRGSSAKRKRGAALDEGLAAEQKAEWKNAIFASNIAKYVFKKGRMTIHPELALRNSGLVPPRPDDLREGEDQADDGWTWERIEKERLRGLKIAEHFGALDGEAGLHDEFPVGEDGKDAGLMVLGEFKDLYL